MARKCLGRLCSVPNCGRKHYGLGYCTLHYDRFKYRNGNIADPEKPANKPGEGGLGNGYMRITVNGERQFEHRIIMSNFLGRPLLESEVVHHIDGNKLNNNIKNLEILDRVEHARKHFNIPKGFLSQIQDSWAFSV